jgi:LacI family transcriptional regulator
VASAPDNKESEDGSAGTTASGGEASAGGPSQNVDAVAGRGVPAARADTPDEVSQDMSTGADTDADRGFEIDIDFDAAGHFNADDSLAGRKGVPSPLTIYDVARHAGVSIASVSRVLNGHVTPKPDTRDRVLHAVAELGFVPDGAARALSSRLKEVIAVVYRRAPVEPAEDPVFEDAADNLVFVDVINRGIEAAAQRRGYDLLISSVEVHDHIPGARIAKLVGKSDGMLLHDRVLTPSGIEWLADHVPVVTLAGTPTRASVNVGSDNASGMRDLINHLIEVHGCRSIAYLSGHAGSPDSVMRGLTASETAARHGVTVESGPQWAGTYSATGGARVIRSLLDSGGALPDAIACANDQTALGVLYALRERGYRVPQDVAVTGFDDVPVARHLIPPLTTVRQPIQELGALAFDVLHAMIGGGRPAERQLILPVQIMIRGSCGCPAEPAPPAGGGGAHRARMPGTTGTEDV